MPSAKEETHTQAPDGGDTQTAQINGNGSSPQTDTHAREGTTSSRLQRHPAEGL